MSFARKRSSDVLFQSNVPNQSRNKVFVFGWKRKQFSRSKGQLHFKCCNSIDIFHGKSSKKLFYLKFRALDFILARTLVHSSRCCCCSFDCCKSQDVIKKRLCTFKLGGRKKSSHERITGKIKHNYHTTLAL